MKSKVQISTLLGTLLAATMVLGGATSASAGTTLPAIPAVASSALQPLTGADTLLTTFFSKSKISGEIEKDSTTGNMITLDNNGDPVAWNPGVNDDNVNFPFTFAGQIYVPGINQADGKLLATTGPIGTVSGTVLFP